MKNDRKIISLKAGFSVTALKNLLSGNSNAPLSSSLPLTIQESSLHKFYLQKTFDFLTISVYFQYFDCSIIKIATFLLRYIFLKSINIGPLILHCFRITNQRSIIFLKTSIYIQIVIRWASIHRLSICIIVLPTTENWNVVSVSELRCTLPQKFLRCRGVCLR